MILTCIKLTKTKQNKTKTNYLSVGDDGGSDDGGNSDEDDGYVEDDGGDYGGDEMMTIYVELTRGYSVMAGICVGTDQPQLMINRKQREGKRRVQ